jgi:hypothetical protein
MSFSRWQKLRDRMTAKVVPVAEAVEVVGLETACAAAGADMVLSVMTVE